MGTVTISKTKDYLVLKIPLKALRPRRSVSPSREDRAVADGLRALEQKKIVGPFLSAKTAIKNGFAISLFVVH